MNSTGAPSPSGLSDEALERWLREDVAAAYDAMKRDPARGIPADEVFAALRRRHAARESGR